MRKLLHVVRATVQSHLTELVIELPCCGVRVYTMGGLICLWGLVCTAKVVEMTVSAIMCMKF